MGSNKKEYSFRYKIDFQGKLFYCHVYDYEKKIYIISNVEKIDFLDNPIIKKFFKFCSLTNKLNIGYSYLINIKEYFITDNYIEISFSIFSDKKLKEKVLIKINEFFKKYLVKRIERFLEDLSLNTIRLNSLLDIFPPIDEIKKIILTISFIEIHFYMNPTGDIGATVKFYTPDKVYIFEFDENNYEILKFASFAREKTFHEVIKVDSNVINTSNDKIHYTLLYYDNAKYPIYLKPMYYYYFDDFSNSEKLNFKEITIEKQIRHLIFKINQVYDQFLKKDELEFLKMIGIYKNCRRKSWWDFFVEKNIIEK